MSCGRCTESRAAARKRHLSYPPRDMLPIIFAAVLTHTIVRADQPFEAAALSWRALSVVAVRVRVSDDGKEWSEWMPLAIDDDSSDPSAGRYVTAIAHFGFVKRYVE